MSRPAPPLLYRFDVFALILKRFDALMIYVIVSFRVGMCALITIDSLLDCVDAVSAWHSTSLQRTWPEWAGALTGQLFFAFYLMVVLPGIRPPFSAPGPSGRVR